MLSAMIAQVADRTDLIVCVDGLGPLLRGESGGRHNVLLRRALKESRVQLVAIMETNDYSCGEEVAVTVRERCARRRHVSRASLKYDAQLANIERDEISTVSNSPQRASLSPR